MIPSHFFSDKLTIGLNQAFKFICCTYNLTIHPELIPEEAVNDGRQLWITKRKGEKGSWSSVLEFDDPRLYVFENNSRVLDFEYCRNRLRDKLYTGRGIQATGITLAAHMGARTVVLVGCDMTSLGGDHHCQEQHVRFHGLQPTDVYDEYYECTAIVRNIVRLQYNCDVITLSPFLGENRAGEDYRRLLYERQMSSFPPPQDTSGYVRERDFA